ncbi:hypothetical protein F5X68DRAFT_15876 [Plectosphaerella plurivora]|uniref:Uncharacterized protein n=1 Tax=Plectosphaerella plurivora TaxID=936078 RepID=A0A9P8V952_9PEZI|nr:hypothetical protein F5X68DRAFT_15876 [Plectosphaerella plurivora]
MIKATPENSFGQGNAGWIIPRWEQSLAFFPSLNDSLTRLYPLPFSSDTDLPSPHAHWHPLTMSVVNQTPAINKFLGTSHGATELLSDAVQDHPEHAAVLNLCKAECSKALKVVKFVKKNKPLQTSGGLVILHRLQEAAEGLTNQLYELGGSSAAERLPGCRDKLRSARSSLYKEIRMACPGLTKMADGKHCLDWALLTTLDKEVKDLLGSSNGLHLVNFVTEKRLKVDAKSRVYFTKDDLDELERTSISIAHPESVSPNPLVRTRIVANCLADDTALQILAPIEKDVYANVAVVKAEGLIAKGQSTQVGYAITDNVFGKLLEHQLQMSRQNMGV